MGGLSSKKRERKWSWSGPPGDHSPYPVDSLPYPGPELTYCFLDLMASYKILQNVENLGHHAVTTDVDDYHEDLADCYSQGFCLRVFCRVPGVSTTTVGADWEKPHPYQAIFTKPTEQKYIGQESWDIKIEKILLSTRTLAFDEQDKQNELSKMINFNTATGGRLVCATPVGFLDSVSTNTQYRVVGLELFFNLPRHPHPTQYVYHTARLKAHYHIVPDVTQTIQQILCDADFMGQMTKYLNNGWKLVDLCMDTAALNEAFKMRATSKMVDTVWMFEKEASLLYNDTPMYEGVIIEYIHKIKTSGGGETPCRDWRPVIAGMGVSGWELAAVVQTPALLQSSFTKYTMKLLLFFQRRLIPGYERLKTLRSSSSLPHDFSPGDRGAFRSRPEPSRDNRSREAELHGYYHHGLQRYVYRAEPVSNGFIGMRCGPEPESPPPAYNDVLNMAAS